MANKLISDITAITALKGSDQVEVESGGQSYSATVKLIMPAGAVIPFCGTSTPEGYLDCDGSAVSRTTYADLFSAIGTTWGVGDGSSTFNVPDLQGAFLRGAGDGTINARTKSGGSVGDTTEDQMQGHKHNFDYKDANANEGFTESNYRPRANSGGASFGQSNAADSENPNVVADPIADGTNGTPRTGAETYPYNATVKYCIKY